MALYIQNSDFSTRMTSLYGYQPSPVVLCMQNRDFRTRLTILYGSQTSPVVLCLQNSVISTSLYGFHTSSVIFGCKTATFGPELQVSMGPSSHLSSCEYTTASFAPERQVYIGSSHNLWFCAFKTVTLAWRFVIRVQRSLFCLQKAQVRAGTHRD